MRSMLSARVLQNLGTEGGVAVELALVLPILVSLIIAALDFASLFNTSQALAAATRAGAEYARNSSTCQSGIDVLQSPQIKSGCTTGIENTTQNSFTFNPALTFPNDVTLACYCDGDGGAITCGNYSCASQTPSRGNNEVFVKVTARATFTPIVALPGMPTTLNGLTLLRLQ